MDRLERLCRRLKKGSCVVCGKKPDKETTLFEDRFLGDVIICRKHTDEVLRR